MHTHPQALPIQRRSLPLHEPHLGRLKLLLQLGHRGLSSAPRLRLGVRDARQLLAQSGHSVLSIEARSALSAQVRADLHSAGERTEAR